ncbi:NADH:ubiquinone oxidoreductase subunit 5 (chain L)/multisubunit Na+/H+ antiporter, MnhA subunit [Mycolicibacterium chubuense NBB4]|uniref:NADH:ubiquinone oxidoreductase subunit 5 (Chain L)/multisubunit Na+/H+ antiporter, MnhA subunit n=1 Tax=Mycolicibacterium chubuense (strain NBB4) TaxID=710421 RepID=I4BLG7_MYCCN|nr:proton-conducting transporter membrane subunit [Mycolicibacterium chubuense]AFM18124.1 NADH:ubiquinone oxidoreductase subunit 5 (chain L)/multisubunit Na+/H+ antiporter, MnhA subunit [Mycolicibacterium chubuense NBB4]
MTAAMLAGAQWSLWGLVGLPAAGGIILSLNAFRSPTADRLPSVVSVAVSAVMVALSAVVAVARPTVDVPFMAGADLTLRVDALAATMAATVAVTTLLVLIFTVGDDSVAGGRFYGLMLVFAAAAMLTVTAATLPALLLAWEVMGAVSYGLIGFWWRENDRVSAGLTAFLTTRTADLGLYLAAGGALAGGAGLALADLADASGGWRHVIAAGFLVAALGKAAQLPFSFWLSRAMEGPSPVSALLHSAAMVALGAYLLLRMGDLLAASGWAAPAAAWLGVATAVVLGAVALAQRDLKQLLAASTSAQLGFVVMAAGLAAISGGATQLVAHAATKAGLFLTAGAWLSLVGSKRLDDLQGIGRRRPLVGVTAAVSALALAGVAPLSLWATKDEILAAAQERSVWLYLAGLAAAGLSAAYSGKVLLVVWRRPRQAPSEQLNRSTLSGWQQEPLVVLAAGAALAGVLALPPVGPRLSRALDHGATPHATVLEWTISAVLAAVVVLAVLRWGAPEPRWLVGWLGLQKGVDAVVVAPTLRLARLVARFDDRVIDRAVHAAAAGAMTAATGAARLDVGGVDRSVRAVAGLMRRLGELARKPQTGQLHHYYLSAVALVVLAVLLLIVAR